MGLEVVTWRRRYQARQASTMIEPVTIGLPTVANCGLGRKSCYLKSRGGAGTSPRRSLRGGSGACRLNTVRLNLQFPS
jgi:hypothetical protein